MIFGEFRLAGLRATWISGGFFANHERELQNPSSNVQRSSKLLNQSMLRMLWSLVIESSLELGRWHLEF